MTKKISEVTIKIKGTGIKTVSKDVSKLLADMETLTAASEALNASFNEGGRSDAVLSRMADSAERTEKEFRQLNATSVNTLKLLEEQLHQTAFATEDARESADRLGKEWQQNEKVGRKLRNGLKDTNRQGTNQVRVFSKMARAGGSLTIAYAVVAANVFALSEAFRVMNNAASVERLSEVSSVMSNSLGISIKSTANALVEATDAAVSYQEALKLAASSAAYGFDTEQMEQLALVAKRASVVLGVEMTDALQRVTRGIAKQEVELLDELGLTIRMTEAFSKYAAAHGIAAGSLNSFQRQQAFTNEVIAKSEEGLSSVDEALASTSWERFGAAVSTTTNELLQAISTSEWFTGLLDGITEGLDRLRGPMKGMNHVGLTAKTERETPFYGKDRAGTRYEDYSFRVGAADPSMYVDTPGKDQLSKVKEGDLRGAIAAHATLRKEWEDAVDTLQELDALRKRTTADNDYDAILAKEGKTMTLMRKEYADLVTYIAGLGSLMDKAAAKTNLMGEGSINANKALMELSQLGKTFNSDLDKIGNEVFGVADTTLQKQIDDINKAADKAREATKGQFDNDELLERAKVTADLLAGRAQDIANYQQMLIGEKQIQLSIEQEGLRGDEKKLALAESALAAAGNRATLEQKVEASTDKQLATMKAYSAAEEVIFSILEKRLMLQLQSSAAHVQHINRGFTEVTQAQVALDIAKAELIVAQNKHFVSQTTLENLKKEVDNKERLLELSKEQAMLTQLDNDTAAMMHDNRGTTALYQAELGVELAKENLRVAKESGNVSGTAIAALEAEVRLKERALDVGKDKNAEDIKAAKLQVSSQIASNIGSLDSGMGQAASGLVQMAEGWDKLGDAAASSAEKIKAASMIAGGFQSALGGLINSAAGMVASGIDAEIAAVKRSGLTQEEQEKKIYKLQKRKIKEQEKYTKASILLNTAMGVAGALAMQPWTPLNFALAAMTAAAGAMAYQQASNTAAAQLGNLAGGSSSADNSRTISVGGKSTPKTDLTKSASASERGEMLGERGVYGRAVAGNARANTPYITSESGSELIVPKVDSKVYNATDTDKILSGSRGASFAPVIHVNALDSQSLEDRMPEILSMLQEQAEQQGFSIEG